MSQPLPDDPPEDFDNPVTDADESQNPNVVPPGFTPPVQGEEENVGS